MFVDKNKEQREKDVVEFCRDMIRVWGIKQSIYYVVAHLHKESYADLKHRWCTLANELTDAECRAMWAAGDEAKLPERLRDEELERCFHVDKLISDAVDEGRKLCQHAAGLGLQAIAEVMMGVRNNGEEKE